MNHIFEHVPCRFVVTQRIVLQDLLGVFNRSLNAPFHSFNHASYDNVINANLVITRKLLFMKAREFQWQAKVALKYSGTTLIKTVPAPRRRREGESGKEPSVSDNCRIVQLLFQDAGQQFLEWL